MIKKFLVFTVLFTVAIGTAACGRENSPEETAGQSLKEETASETEGANAHGEDAGSETEQSSSGSKESSAQQDSLEEQDSEDSPEVGTANEENEFQELVVYFSWSGNTRSVANEIQAQTGADIFEIIPAEPYTDDYDTLLDVAQEEQTEEARPDIEGEIENFQQYDRVYLGFPNWWGDMPMILYTFLEEYDFSGKTIAPFVTSGGSGFSGTLDTIGEMEPEAEITQGLSLGSSAASNPEKDVAEWLSDIGD